MAFNFDEVLKNDKNIEGGLNGKKILCYASNNCGKTYQCTRISPKTLLIATEAGDACVTCPKTSCTTWGQFKEIVTDLTKPANLAKRREQIEIVVIDTASNLVELSEVAVCNQFGVRDLSEITGRQNGYKICRTDFKTQINKLCLAGYCVIFIDHEERVELKDEVTGEDYTFIQPKGTSNEKSSMRLLRDLCDFTIYLKPNPVDPETFKVVPSTAICVRTKGVFARSRFDIQPIINPFTADGLKKAIEDAIKKSAENEGAGLIDFDINNHKDYKKEDYFEIIKPYIEKLYTVCPDELQMIVAAEFGNRKITEATDDELVKLDNVYNNLVTKATLLGVEI